jgi:hypothetical protein
MLNNQEEQNSQVTIPEVELKFNDLVATRNRLNSFGIILTEGIFPGKLSEKVLDAQIYIKEMTGYLDQTIQNLRDLTKQQHEARMKNKRQKEQKAKKAAAKEKNDRVN